jgi:hypothetical protein
MTPATVAATRHHLKIVGDEYGIDKAEPLDRILDQLELLPRMRPGVARIGPQPVGRDVLDCKIWHGTSPEAGDKSSV